MSLSHADLVAIAWGLAKDDDLEGFITALSAMGSTRETARQLRLYRPSEEQLVELGRRGGDAQTLADFILARRSWPEDEKVVRRDRRRVER